MPAYHRRRAPKRLVTVNLTRVARGILMAVADGVNSSGNRMFAHAKGHVPVRKIYQVGGFSKGRGRGLRLQSPQEVQAEVAIRKKIGLGPKPGESPFAALTRGRVNSQNLANPLAQRNRHHVDTYNTRLPTEYKTGKKVDVDTPSGRRRRDEVASFAVDDESTSPYRAVRQIEYSHAKGGYPLRAPTSNNDRSRGVFRGGSLRKEEQRRGLPFGALGKYELEHTTSLAQHLTARGRYELGILKSGAPSTALHAGRAVTTGESGDLQVGGRLKRELHVAQEAQAGPVMTFRVVSPTPYAKYVEFGTRHAGAQPYLRPAVAHIRERLRSDIKRAIKRAAASYREV